MMKTNKHIKKISWMLVLIMLVSLIPQFAFADVAKGASSIDWDWPNGAGNVASIGNEWIALSGMEKEDIGFKSTDESVLPSKCIWAEDAYTISYLPIKEGTTTVTMYNKKEPSVNSTELKITVSKGKTMSTYPGKALSLSLSGAPVACKYNIDDKSVAVVDSEGRVTGKQIGKTVLHITSDEIPDMDCTKDIEVKEDPTGIYYNDKKVTTLEYSKTQGESIQLKIISGEYLSPSDVTGNVVYDSSNVDVAEPVYKSSSSHTGTGEIKLKKNGAATIYVYTQVQRKTLLGTCKITTSGFDESSVLDNGWRSCTDPQGYYTKVQVLDLPVETQSYDEAYFENKITQFLKSNSIEFSLKLTNTGKKYTITDEQKTAYEKEILSRVNICQVNKDGSIGKKVAGNGTGYKLKFSSYETQNSTETNLNIAVDKNILKKGATYALVVDKDVDAGANHVEYYQTGVGTHLPIGVPASWTFTTVGSAQNIVLNQTKATLKGGNTLILKATLNEGLKVDADDTVAWSSSNSKVASVDKNGKVTAKTAGFANITAQAVNGKVKAICKITVSPEKVKEIKVNTKRATLTVGSAKTIKATITPLNATNKSVIWTSSNSQIAKVNSKGKVTAVAPGKATITVKTKDGSFKANTTISVRPKTTFFKLTAKRAAVTISYKKVSNVTGYQIYRAKSKNGTFKKITTRSQKRTGKYTSTHLSRKHSYYYKIRTYKTVKGKKIYGNFSKTVRAKTK